MSQRIGKYLLVDRRPKRPCKNTCRWDVLGNDGGRLGTIEWYGPWRCYVFHPETEWDTLFNSTCLDDISKFLADNRNTRETDAGT